MRRAAEHFESDDTVGLEAGAPLVAGFARDPEEQAVLLERAFVLGPALDKLPTELDGVDGLWHDPIVENRRESVSGRYPVRNVGHAAGLSGWPPVHLSGTYPVHTNRSPSPSPEPDAGSRRPALKRVSVP